MAKIDEGGVPPRAPSAAEFDNFALRLLGYLGVDATHARRKLLADRLTTVYDAGQRTGARLGTCGKRWHGGLGGNAPHPQEEDCLLWRPMAAPHAQRGHSAECGGQPAGSVCICGTGFNDAAAELWMVLLECTGGHGPDCDPVSHIRAVLAGVMRARDTAERRAHDAERILVDLAPGMAAAIGIAAEPARSDSGRPPDNEIAAQVRRDNGED